MVRSIERDPFEGGGTPINLPLIGENVWFRRLSLIHRVVYEAYQGVVVIAAFRLHLE